MCPVDCPISTILNELSSSYTTDWSLIAMASDPWVYLRRAAVATEARSGLFYSKA